jgi:hypothetical protein
MVILFAVVIGDNFATESADLHEFPTKSISRPCGLFVQRPAFAVAPRADEREVELRQHPRRSHRERGGLDEFAGVPIT